MFAVYKLALLYFTVVLFVGCQHYNADNFSDEQVLLINFSDEQVFNVVYLFNVVD